MTRYFEDIQVGSETALPSIYITPEMRARHVEMYGEDWRGEILERMIREGVLPAPLTLSIIAGQMGASEFVHIEFLKEFRVKCFHPIRVGDTISTKILIAAKRPHTNPKRGYGYVTVEQRVYNQEGTLCFERVPTYTVPLRQKI